MQALRGLHHSQPGISRGDREKLDVLAGLLRDGHHLREQVLLGGGEDLIGIQVVFARRRGRNAVDRKHHDVHFARIGFGQRLFQMLEMKRIAAGDQYVARTRVHFLLRNLRALIQSKLLQVLTVTRVLFAVDPLRDGE